MATKLDQQVALDEALVLSAQRLQIGRSNFRLPSDIQSKEPTLQVEFWAIAKLHQHSILYKMDTRKHVLDLEAFREMLHISPRILGQSFAELPFEEEILEFLRDDVLFSTIKVVSRHQTTQQYGVILPIELTNDDIRNSKAYKEYYACATGEAAPKPKASARKKTGGSALSTTPPTLIATPTPTTTIVAAPRLSVAAKGKQPARATTPTEPTDVERTEAEQLKIVLKRSRQETYISQQRGSSTDEGTGVPDVPSDDSEEELSWNSSDDEDVDEQTKGREESEGDKTDESDDEDERSKIDVQEVIESDEGDNEATESERESEDEETREQEEESFDPIPRTPEDNKDDDNNEEDQGLRIGMESIFTTGSTTITPIPSPQSTMTPSIILTFTSASQLPTPPTQIPSLDLQSLPTFATSYAVAADLLEMELKKILINKMEGNKSIQRSDEQRNLYKVLVEAYDADKTILDIYGESTILKRRRKDDDQEGPSAGSDRGLKRRREGGEHASASTLSVLATGSAGRSTIGALAKQTDARSSFNELLDTPINFSNFIMNRLGVDTLTPELLAGLTYELMRGSCNSLTELEYHLKEVYKVTADQLDWVNPEGQQYPHNLLQPLPLIPD
nr:hypothetical protein [Tanacetum cinerariifolium]